ncbi:MAG: type 4a pilus biogenesis protein PilO [Candidatus Gorgyraea atricola]|nr:type 4a pilus biogenesis protein PilO [Candidatus Gorgyraea atricola]
MNISKREKYISIIATGVVVLALAYNFLIDPLFKKWHNFNNDIIKNEIALKKGLKLLENRNDIIKEYNSYASTTRTLSRILSYIEKHAISTGVKTANIKPRPVVEKGYYKEYVIELQVEGTFSAINKFASKIIEPPLLITIKKFDLRTPTDTPSTLKGTLILSKPLI